ncbi:hypothetical protein EA187_01860 [Lujinxingia sediminis]|uniref:Peptidase MA-like domain-containing protein n=1 Tax=Lujinxingia sediminis TaxID=2480984 RepID=A0ABY0CWD6_9DELT|nr:MXAN_6640 family putative metalloprotease [Lujinxingia sediminis]RVU48207.1 hypothetical protein EA187_01860 [Lujinxingia sediminis]
MPGHARRMVAASLATAALALGVGEAQALRPTEAGHPQSYGGEARYLDSPGGHVRVWYATEGEHRSPRVAGDGETPEIAETVAEVGDDVFEAMATHGFRLPLVDSELYPVSADDGGDERFDIYLINFEAGDGQFVPEYCTTGAPERCAGYAMLDHAFVPLYYPSRELAVKIVVSHEIFHAVQAAYRADWPVWASEGSASWYEELVYPEQDDFERLSGYYFEDSARSLNDRARGPSDGFAYGAGIFFYYLDVVFGSEMIVALAERFAASETIEDALQAELAESFGEADDALELFAIYNLFTGELAGEGEGYPQAERFAGVEVVDLPGEGAFNWEQNVDTFSARFARWDVKVPMTLTPVAVEGWPSAKLALLRGGQQGTQGYESVGVGDVVAVGPEDSPVYLVASQGLGEDAVISAQGRLLREEPQTPSSESSEDGGGGCSQAGGGRTSSVVWAFLGLCLMGRRVRRRR